MNFVGRGGGRGMGQYTGWIIDQLESEVEVLVEQRVIEPQSTWVGLWSNVHWLQGQSLVQVGVAIQDSYTVPINRVMAVPGLLCQCWVCTVTRLHGLVVLPQSLVKVAFLEPPACTLHDLATIVWGNHGCYSFSWHPTVLKQASHLLSCMSN